MCEQRPVCDALCTIERLTVRFPLRGQRGRFVHAVERVSLEIPRGACVGVVGESGCGKSTLARAILRLVPVTSGQIVFDGTDVLALRGSALRRFRRRAQIVFQDATGSLNPRLRIETILTEPLRLHGLAATRRDARRQAAELVEQVGLSAAMLRAYPHELSGGQRQRVAIARALAVGPELLICDEPTSALDVSIRSQILNLLAELRARRGLTYLFISHDLSLVRYFCDRVAVMYLGRIVEQASTARLFEQPLHPYTQALLAAAPDLDPDRPVELTAPPGEPPNPADPPPGCPYHPRCPHAEPRCRSELPVLRPAAAGHCVACHVAHAAASEPARIG